MKATGYLEDTDYLQFIHIIWKLEIKSSLFRETLKCEILYPCPTIFLGKKLLTFTSFSFPFLY